MKKIPMILLFFLVFGFFDVAFAEKNPECIRGRKFLVAQVLERGVLAYVCPIVNWHDYSVKTDCIFNGQLVFLTDNDNYVDEQIVKLNRKQCLVEKGTYQYWAKNDTRKTVRKVSIENSRI
ncbi:hypothetical protein IJD44_08775 [bacterium]|nr:hypothetical protein [bacterium]